MTWPYMFGASARTISRAYVKWPTQHLQPNPHLNHEENKIIDALSVSLVAIQDEVIVGYIAVSPVTIRTESGEIVAGWYGGGPLAAGPEFHGKGVGTQLVYAARDELLKLGAPGCVSLGILGYYEKLGCERDDGLRYEGAPEKVFRGVILKGEAVRRCEVS